MNVSSDPERNEKIMSVEAAIDREKARLLFQHDIDAALIVSLDRYQAINLKYAETAGVASQDAADHAADFLYQAACLIANYNLGSRAEFIANAQDLFTKAQEAVRSKAIAPMVRLIES